MNVVVYARTSKDDGVQNPQRQVDVCEAWAGEHGVEVVEAVVDKGSSAFKVPNPFERERVVDAAVGYGPQVEAVVVSEASRWTRGGVEWHFWAKRELDLRYNLELYIARWSPQQQDEEENLQVMAALQAAWAHQESKQISRRTKAGLKSKGAKGGRPRVELPPEELRYVDKRRREDASWEQIEHEVNQRRTAGYKSKRAREKRMVSRRTIQRRFEEWKEAGE